MSRKTIKDLSGMPKMSAAFLGWTVAIDLVRIKQTIVDGIPKDAEEKIRFQGTVQPLSAEEIALKPDGQRSWEWLQVHVIASSKNLEVDDRVRYAGRKYKIMGRKDYTLNGYVEYHMIVDFQKASP